MDVLDIAPLLDSSRLFVVGACVCLIAAIVLRLLAVRLPSSRPPILETVPFIGGILGFLSGPLNLLHKGYTTKGEVFTVPVLHKQLTFLIGPHVTSHFFKASDDLMSQDEVYRFNIPTFGPGVVYDVNHKNRGEQFRIFGEALKTENLMKYLPLFKMETVDYFSKWGEEGDVNLYDALSQLTTLTAARTLLGREIRENLFGEVAQLLHDLDAGRTLALLGKLRGSCIGMVPISVFLPYLPIAVHRKRDTSRKQLKNIFDRVIRQRRASSIVEADMLQHFIESKSVMINELNGLNDFHFRYIRCNDGRYLNDDEIGGLLIAALFGGQHTSSVTSSWTGYFLTHNQKWWDACVEEQKRILTQYGEEITYDVLNDMPILHACIREALRIHPPLLLLMRYVKQDFTVTTSAGVEYTIPKGHIAITSPTYAGRLEHIYNSPADYDPARLMEPREEDKKMVNAYLPFGAGRHGCMGHNFAFLQIKTIWSYLIRNFEFQKLDPFPAADYDAMVVGIKPCKVSFKRRLLTK